MAVSVGAFIHGTTVSFPAVSIPSICKSNNTNRTEDDAFMPFFVTDNDIQYIGKNTRLFTGWSICGTKEDIDYWIFFKF